MIRVPKSLQRRATEVEGWLELECPEQALAKLDPLLETPGARPAALHLQVRALVGLQRHEDALESIEDLRHFDHDPEWLDLTEAWCLKRTGDVEGAADCMRRLVERTHRSSIGHYNLGCYLALLGNKDEAIEEISLACGMEAEFRRLAAEEDDLESLRGDPRFDGLLAV